jgi:hypothetical protein
MRLTFVTTFCIAMLCGAASAQDYPWCVGSGDGLVDCSYSTYEQCQESASGRGGCFQNPRAALNDGATDPAASTKTWRRGRHAAQRCRPTSEPQREGSRCDMF